MVYNTLYFYIRNKLAVTLEDITFFFVLGMVWDLFKILLPKCKKLSMNTEKGEAMLTKYICYKHTFV